MDNRLWTALDSSLEQLASQTGSPPHLRRKGVGETDYLKASLAPLEVREALGRNVFLTGVPSLQGKL